MTRTSKPREFWIIDEPPYSLSVSHTQLYDSSDEDEIHVIEYAALAEKEKQLAENKAVIQRQAELISYLIKEQPDLAKIKERFEASL